MTEFNLSKKRFVDGDDYTKHSYYEEDVKEFIRLVKEEIALHKPIETWHELLKIQMEKIDKLAGDKLTK